MWGDSELALKIRRSNLKTTAGGTFGKISKFECRVIKHTRKFSRIFCFVSINFQYSFPRAPEMLLIEFPVITTLIYVIKMI